MVELKGRNSLALGAVVTVLLSLVITGLSGATTVRVLIEPPEVSAGDDFSVRIIVAEVTDMAANGAILHFEPAALQATDITAGVINTFPQVIIDNTAGTVTFGYAKSGAGVSGSNVTLAIIDFTALAVEGLYDLNLTDLELYNSALQLIPTDTYNGTVTIATSTPSPSPTPTPINNRWDINEDCTVNFIDLTILSAHWLETPTAPLPRYDINEDGVINFIDLTILSAHWLETTC